MASILVQQPQSSPARYACAARTSGFRQFPGRSLSANCCRSWFPQTSHFRGCFVLIPADEPSVAAVTVLRLGAKWKLNLRSSARRELRHASEGAARIEAVPCSNPSATRPHLRRDHARGSADGHLRRPRVVAGAPGYVLRLGHSTRASTNFVLTRFARLDPRNASCVSAGAATRGES